MIWLLNINAVDPGGVLRNIVVSSGEYHGTGVAWYPLIKQPGLYSDGLFAGDLLNVGRSGIGEATLINAGGMLDYLADWSVDGRDVVLQQFDGESVTDVWKGTASRLVYTRNEVQVRLRDPGARIDKPHPHEVFAGDNVLPDGLEGTEDDIKGQPKPKVYGDVRNASPALVNSSKLIYQVSSRYDCTVSAVYDAGSPLTPGTPYTSRPEMQSVAPSAGEFRAYQGFCRLGDSPIGAVTVDASSSQDLAGDVMEFIAYEAGIQVSHVDMNALDAVGPIGIYLTDVSTTSAIFDRIAVSVGGYWRLAANGTVHIGFLSRPSSPVGTLLDYQIESISRSATGSGDNGVPVWKVVVKADRVETTQTNLTGSATDARRSRLANKYRQSIAESQATLNRHPLSSEVMINSDIRSLTDAQAIADRLLALVSVRRDRCTLVGRIDQTNNMDIGKTITVKTSKLGYSQGRDMMVIGRELNARTGKITLDLWG